ncbi:MAG TPA: helix-turn-helix domain-containing protein [Pyrinomonadaceae bacterium]|nr:helix-turn-helix domain-containing protein [Pyrinomonadaceae bacterium]
MGDESPTKEDGRREEFLTARQLAEVLQVSESTVRKLSREGRIPVVRLTPRLARYKLAAVLRALDGDTSSKQKRAARQQPANDAQLSFDDLG